MTNIEKRICAFLMACTLCFSMVMPAMAEEAYAESLEKMLEEPAVPDVVETETELSEQEPVQTEPAQTEPAQTEPAQTEPPQTETADQETETLETEMTEVSEVETELQSEIELQLGTEEMSETELETEENRLKAAADRKMQEWKYEILDKINRTVAIIGYNGTDSVLEIPSEIIVSEERENAENGNTEMVETTYTVVEIGDFAFSENKNLIEVKIPSTVANISYEAFYYCTELASVTLESGIKKIGNDAFCGCSKLRKINFPDGLQKIGRNAFYETGLVSVEFPDSVTEIGESAFRFSRIRTAVLPQSLTKIEKLVFENSKLTTITIPDSVTTIGEFAFAFCSNLTEVRGGRGITDISNWAFSTCTSLSTIDLSGEIEHVGEDAFVSTAWYDNLPEGEAYLGKVLYGYKGDMQENSSLTVKAGTSCIAENAFKNQQNLVSIVLTEELKGIGEEAFFETGLKSLYIPASVKKIGLEAVGYNEMGMVPDFVIYGYAGTAAEVYANEEGIPFEEWNSDISECKIFGISDTYEYTGTEIIPEITVINKGMVVSAENYVVSCQNNIKIGIATVVIEGTGLLHGRITKTFEIVRPSAEQEFLYKIVSEAKKAAIITGYTGKEEKIVIPKTIMAEPKDGNGKTEYTVVGIGKKAFEHNKTITEVTIPNTVTEVQYASFGDCGNLKNVIFEENSQLKTIGESAFQYNISLEGFTCPETLRTIGEAAFGGNTAQTYIYLNDKLETIEPRAFEYSGLRSVEIPNTVKYIKAKTFFRCSELSSVILGKNVEALENSAYYGCTKLKKINLPDRLKSIGIATFSITGLTSIRIPDNVTEIGGDAFACSDLESVVLSKKLESIGSCAFYGTKLSAVDIPDSVTYIGSRAFWDCKNLTDVKIGNGLMCISNDVFCESGVKNLVIGNRVQKIERGAFASNKNLTTVKIPSSVTVIQYRAFYDCSNLLSIELPGAIEHLGRETFHETAWYNHLTDGAAYLGKALYTYKGTMPKNSMFSVKAGTYCIAEEACINQTNLTEISLPEGLKSIDTGAFLHTGLKEVYVPASVSEIGVEALGYRSETGEMGNFQSRREFTDREFGVIEGYSQTSVDPEFTICGYPGTEAEAYAKHNGIRFKALNNDISKCTVEGIAASYTYTGASIMPGITVKNGGQTVSPNDYRVTYKNNMNVGTATVVITGKGTWKGSITKTFRILPISVKNCSISGLSKAFDYTGKSIQPKITVKIGNKTISTANYSVSYQNNKKIGKATVTIKGRGCLSGSTVKSFVIQPKISVSSTKYTKTMGSSSFKLNVKANGGAKLKYSSNNKNVVTVKNNTVSIKGCGKAVITVSASAQGIKSEKRITVIVNPKKMAAPSLKAKRRTLTISWKKAAGSTGYELQYSANKKFTGSSTKTLTLKKATLTKKILSGLAEKTYYVRIRAYGRDGVKGSWSNAAKVRIKG